MANRSMHQAGKPTRAIIKGAQAAEQLPGVTVEMELADGLARGSVQCCEQRRGAVADPIHTKCEPVIICAGVIRDLAQLTSYVPISVE